MTKELSFKDSGWTDYLYWQTKDKKTLTVALFQERVSLNH